MRHQQDQLRFFDLVKLMTIQQVLFRSIVSMPIAEAPLFALALLEPGAARAENCSVDPFGAEACLPTPDLRPPLKVRTIPQCRHPSTFPNALGAAHSSLLHRPTGCVSRAMPSINSPEPCSPPAARLFIPAGRSSESAQPPCSSRSACMRCTWP